MKERERERRKREGKREREGEKAKERSEQKRLPACLLTLLTKYECCALRDGERLSHSLAPRVSRSLVRLRYERVSLRRAKRAAVKSREFPPQSRAKRSRAKPSPWSSSPPLSATRRPTHSGPAIKPHQTRAELEYIHTYASYR